MEVEKDGSEKSKYGLHILFSFIKKNIDFNSKRLNDNRNSWLKRVKSTH